MDGSYLHQSLSAEYLVASDLTKQGYAVSTAAEGLPYDLLVDVGVKVLRVQVKSTKGLRASNPNKSTARYIFRISKIKGNQYTKNSFDIIAFVASDIGLVGYLPIGDVIDLTTILLKGPDQSNGLYTQRDKGIQDLPFNEALQPFLPTFSLDEELTKAFGKKSTQR